MHTRTYTPICLFAPSLSRGNIRLEPSDELGSEFPTCGLRGGEELRSGYLGANPLPSDSEVALIFLGCSMILFPSVRNLAVVVTHTFPKNAWFTMRDSCIFGILGNRTKTNEWLALP